MALISAILCVVLMFLMDWRYAAGTIGCQLLLGLFIYYRSATSRLNILILIIHHSGNQTLTGAVLLML